MRWTYEWVVDKFKGFHSDMNFLLPSIFLVLTLVTAPAAQAGEYKGVVELFTSQGCSSCPPADAELARLAEAGEVLALSYHVDYWNYLGWKDTLSDPENTARQYGYATTWGSRNVYTPQAVVNGLDHANGADRNAVSNLVEGFASAGTGLNIDISLTREKGTISVNIPEGTGKAEIVVIYFDQTNTVDIGRGENMGKKITYHHSVRDIEVLGMWSGAQMSIVLPETVLGSKPGRGCAILLQKMSDKGTPSEILGVAAWIPSSTN